jgi:hypothetical protein
LLRKLLKVRSPKRLQTRGTLVLGSRSFSPLGPQSSKRSLSLQSPLEPPVSKPLSKVFKSSSSRGLLGSRALSLTVLGFQIGLYARSLSTSSIFQMPRSLRSLSSRSKPLSKVFKSSSSRGLLGSRALSLSVLGFQVGLYTRNLSTSSIFQMPWSLRSLSSRSKPSKVFKSSNFRGLLGSRALSTAGLQSSSNSKKS